MVRALVAQVKDSVLNFNDWLFSCSLICLTMQWSSGGLNSTFQYVGFLHVLVRVHNVHWCASRVTALTKIFALKIIAASY